MTAPRVESLSARAAAVMATPARSWRGRADLERENAELRWLLSRLLTLGARGAQARVIAALRGTDEAHPIRGPELLERTRLRPHQYRPALHLLMRRGRVLSRRDPEYRGSGWRKLYWLAPLGRP